MQILHISQKKLLDGSLSKQLHQKWLNGRSTETNNSTDCKEIEIHSLIFQNWQSVLIFQKDGRSNDQINLFYLRFKIKRLWYHLRGGRMLFFFIFVSFFKISKELLFSISTPFSFSNSSYFSFSLVLMLMSLGLILALTSWLMLCSLILFFFWSKISC